jgi:integrase
MECIKCKKGVPEDALFCPWCGKKQQAAPRKAKKRVNGQGSVIKKSGNRSKPWEAQKAGVYIGCYATKHEAEQALLKLADRRTLEGINMTFREVYEKWLPEHSRTISAQGEVNYKAAFKHCSPLHEKAFRKLRTDDFQSIINAMEEKGLSKSSCQKVVQLFGQLSQWAIREEICHTNYAKFVTVLAQQKSTKEPFTPEQIHRIQISENMAADVAMIMIATGCRPNELFSATVENCFDTYFISGSKTEAGKNRVIPVSPVGLEAYRKLLEAARAKNSKKLIDGYPGNKSPKNFANRDWKALMDSLEIQNMTPYNCRHTYTTLAVKSGVKPELLQKILGHADYSTTVEVYTHLDTQELLTAAQSVTIL